MDKVITATPDPWGMSRPARRKAWTAGRLAAGLQWQLTLLQTMQLLGIREGGRGWLGGAGGRLAGEKKERVGL